MVYEISIEEAYGPTDISVDDAYEDFDPWKQRLQDVGAGIQERTDDPDAAYDYVQDRWRQDAMKWVRGNFSKTSVLNIHLADKDPEIRKFVTDQAVKEYQKSMPEVTRDRIQDSYFDTWRETGARESAMSDFFDRRQQIGMALIKQYEMKNPDATLGEAKKYALEELLKSGYDPADEELRAMLPEITRQEELAPLWKAIPKAAIQHLWRGTMGMFSIPGQLFAIGGEVMTDLSRKEGQGELEKVDVYDRPYLGWYQPRGQLKDQEKDNWFRTFRKANKKVLDDLAPVPNDPRFAVWLTGAVAEMAPQLATVVTGALAAKGLQLAGKTAQAAVVRGMTLGTVGALEGTTAFDQYMEYAKAKGVSPEDASLTAFLAANVYAAVSTGLEYLGPFSALEKRIPGLKRRGAAIALMMGTEGGTEALQRGAQGTTAMLFGILDVTPKNLGEMGKEMVLEGLVGAIAGGGAGAITFSPGATPEMRVVDPEALNEQTAEILAKAEAEHGAPDVSDDIDITYEEAYAAMQAGDVIDPQEATRPDAPVAPVPLPPYEAPTGQPSARSKAIAELSVLTEAGLQTVVNLDAEEHQAWAAEKKAAGQADIGSFAASIVERYTAALARGNSEVADTVQAELTKAVEERSRTVKQLVAEGQTQEDAEATVRRWAGEDIPQLRRALEAINSIDDAHKQQPIGKPNYHPTDRPTQEELATIREAIRNREYAPGRVIHVTSLDALKSIAAQGIQPTETADGDAAVSGSWTDAAGKLTGAAASYGRGGVPVALVLKSGVETPGGKGPGDVVGIHSEGKSYVAPGDIDAVFVGADPWQYNLTDAQATYSAEAIQVRETGAAIEAAPATDSMEDAAGVEDVPDGIPAKGFLEGVKDLLSDETGALPIDGMGNALKGGIAGAAEEASLIRGGAVAVTLDESAPLKKSQSGREALAIIDEADSRRRVIYSSHLRAFDQALLQLPTRRRTKAKQWMRALRDDGATNWSTLIEHPERVQNIPEDVGAALTAYQNMQTRTGEMAEAVKLPQLRQEKTPDGKTEWVTAPFQRAKAGKYFRTYTQDGMDMFVYQDGHYLWDSLVDYFMKYPERNPGLDTSDPAKLRQQLKGMKQSGLTKKAGSLEFVRIFKELPVALMGPDGKWVPILQRDPRAHFTAALQQQAQRIAYWSTAQEMLLPRYGTFNEKTGKVEFRQPTMHADLTDVDGLTDRLRRDVTAQAPVGKNARAARSFNRLLDNYQRAHNGGYAEEYLVTLGESKLAQLATAVDRITTASVLQLAPAFDITNPVRTASEVGVWPMLKGRLLSTYTILRTLRSGAFTKDADVAYYKAIGAIIDGHTEWAAHKESWFKDVFNRDVPQALMAVGRWTEERSQFTIAKTFDLWVQELNKRKNVSPFDARVLKEHLRLTDDQVLEISRGEMSYSTRAKVLQSGVNVIAGLTEAAHRKGALQNHPVGHWAFRFLSVVNAVTKQGLQHVSDLKTDLTTVANPNASQAARKQAASMAAQSGWRLLVFVSTIAGSGFLQGYLRRAAYHRPLVEPEDPDTWMGALAEALLEGGIFGPYYRFFEAGKYSNWRLSEMPTKLIFPLGVMAEAGSALLGLGRYKGSDWDRRLEMLGVKFSPAYKAAKGWFASQTAPSREKYTFTSKMVRKFNKDRGVEPPYVQGKRNWKYYEVFEAVRDGNQAAVDEALEGYRTWATDQGWDAEKARKGLAQSLNSRRPVNLNKEAAKKFLAGLPAVRRTLAEQENERYKALVDRITRKPPGYLGGNWYGAK